MLANHPHGSPAADSDAAEEDPILAWKVHLLRDQPRRLAILLCVLALAILCVWAMFNSVLPVITAVLLLLGSASEFLFPISYTVTRDGVAAEAPMSRLRLSWKEVRRCVTLPAGILVTPLPLPSRLDSFRGVLLRCAPDGEQGDRASILRVVARCAPHL